MNHFLSSLVLWPCAALVLKGHAVMKHRRHLGRIWKGKSQNKRANLRLIVSGVGSENSGIFLWLAFLIANHLKSN